MHDESPVPNKSVPHEAREAPPLWRLAWYFFLIALTTVQGAAGHLRKSVVERWRLVSEKDFLESFALAEFLPQPDSTFGLAVHIGHRVRGWSGALVAAIFMLTPSFLLSLAIGIPFIIFDHITWLKAAAAGAAAAVCAIIGTTLLEIGRKAVCDLRDLVLIMLVFVFLRYGILHISGVLLWVTPFALWLHRPSRHEKLHGLHEPPGMVPTLGFRHFIRHRVGGLLLHKRWGSVCTALFVIALMGVITLSEKEGAPMWERIKSSVIHHNPEKAQICPAVPIAPLPSKNAFPIGPVCTDLVSTFSALSVCAFGGEETILPCMQRASVSHHNWMDGREFVNFFAMSFIIPGPSMLAALIGLKACYPFGLEWAILGSLITLLALFLPNMAVILSAAKSWDWLREWRWRTSVGKALILIASGALAAALMFICETTVTSPKTAAIAICSALLLLLSDLNPVLIMLLSGVAGWLFLS